MGRVTKAGACPQQGKRMHSQISQLPRVRQQMREGSRMGPESRRGVQVSLFQ